MEAPARILDEYTVCRTRAYYMLNRVAYGSLPEDVSRDCARREAALAGALKAHSSLGEATTIWQMDGTQRETPPGSLAVRATGRTVVLRVKPDHAAIRAHGGHVYGVVVEAACTSIDNALPRLVPRLLAYKAWLEACHGPHTVAVYAPLTPPTSESAPWAAAVTVADPAKAADRLAALLEAAAGLLDQPSPPAPGRSRPPCSHCGYRNICPHRGEP